MWPDRRSGASKRSAHLHRVCYKALPFGVYLNLVEGRLWVPAVAGSNPATPTKLFKSAARLGRRSQFAATCTTTRVRHGTARVSPERERESLWRVQLLQLARNYICLTCTQERDEANRSERFGAGESQKVRFNSAGEVAVGPVF